MLVIKIMSMIELLLVEDSSCDADLVVEALSEARVRIHIVEDGVRALAFLRNQGQYQQAPKPDMILLDLNLPQKSGHEVLAEIKSDPLLRVIPVVVMTTSGSPEDIFISYQLQANSVITKPTGLEDFLQIMRSIENFWLAAVKFPTRPSLSLL